MNLIIFSLLICLLMTIDKTAAFFSGDGLEPIMEEPIPPIAVSDGHTLTLESNFTLGRLGGDYYTLMWRGIYDADIQVAVKLTMFKSDFTKELNIYKALNATDKDIETHGIPRVYCHGSFVSWTDGIVYFIAMTLFEGDLEARLRQQRGNISDLSLSLIFRRSVEVLEYIHSKYVIHNDVKPANIFLRGTEVFIGDFDLSTFKGVFGQRSTRRFGSMKYHKSQQRSSIDDLQSLVFSIWKMAGCDPFEPYGIVMLNSIKSGTLKSEVQKNCKHFIDEDIQKTFESVCEEILKESVPDYNAIKGTLTTAINKLSEKTGQKQFEWLSGASSSQSST